MQSYLHNAAFLRVYPRNVMNCLYSNPKVIEWSGVMEAMTEKMTTLDSDGDHAQAVPVTYQQYERLGRQCYTDKYYSMKKN